ncbi:MAG: MoaD/ThiS family protein [Chloroflexi bacterium]|nr:MoaD/ThiS family protein [Chloroflexota bacterium]
MVEHGAGKVRVEIVPWLTQSFGQKGSSRLVMEEEVGGEDTLLDLLSSMNARYPAVGEVIVDLKSGRLFAHVNVVLNDTLVANGAALDQPIRCGDTLTLLPAYVGG